MLSYKYDLSLAEQTKLDALLADVDITNKVVLLVTEDTVHHVDIHLAICIYNGEFEQISLDN